MILVSVGSQMPFDRLVRAVDNWASRARRRDVLAQIGPSRHPPRHIRWKRFLEPPEFRDAVEAATVVVAHAGIGTIVMCLEYQKPLLVVPRRASLRETRNDHQVATAQRFGDLGYVTVAWDEQALVDRLNNLDQIAAGKKIGTTCEEQLIVAIREFIAPE